MKKLNSRIMQIALLILVSIFCGCSSLPSETDAKNDLKKMIDEQSKGKIELLKFEKTNGVKSNVFGQEFYELEFSFVIEFKEECWKSNTDRSGYFTNFWIMAKGPEGAIENLMYGHPKQFKKGDKINLTGKMSFEKTENGWRSTDIYINDPKF